MNWRFADLPIRTKFLITLGIPVMGLIMLIGKQVDSSLKRSDVLGYMSRRADGIKRIANVVDRVQNEGGQTVVFLLGLDPDEQALQLARTRTDSAIGRLNDPGTVIDPRLRPFDVLIPLSTDRNRVDGGDMTARQADDAYRRINDDLLRDLGTSSRQNSDAEVNAKLLAHQSLLYAKDALSEVRTELLRMLVTGATSMELSALNERIILYETNLEFFQRDASSGMLAHYRETFRGAELNRMKSTLGLVRTKGNLADLGITAEEWWDLSGKTMAKLREVEVHSADSIISTSKEVAGAALRRLTLVLVALMVVLGMVVIMATVIMRGLRSTVSEVTNAAAALARGDVREQVPVKSKDEMGQMVASFNQVIETMQSLSASADAIGQGNYDVPVVVRGEQDVLGHSLTRMRDNLKAARDRDMQHNKELLNEKEKLEQANARISVLIREIHHRVKNNLQVVSSMLRLQAGTIQDKNLRQSFVQSQSRVASMALIHEKLYKGGDLSQVELAQYIRELFTELVQLNEVEERIRYRTAIDPDLVLDLDTMVPLGLILNELITNSFKHAFTDGRQGFINLRIHRAEGDEVDLRYSDNGTGIPEDRLNVNDTLGRSLTESLVEQLNGIMTMESDETGTRYHIRFKATH